MLPFGPLPRQSAARRRAPRNYFSRREQLRMMLMLGSLLVVWMLMLEARRPENWVWLTGIGAGTGARQTVDAHSEGADEGASLSESRDSERPRAVVGDGVPPRAPVTSIPPAISPDGWDWSVVRDDLPFNATETDRFLNVLDWWRRTGPKLLAGDVAPSVGCLQLTRQTEEYRGHLVSVSGTVRRAHRITAHANAQDIPGYWRCWLFPDGSDSPIVVYALEMPPSFPRGMAIQERVRFQGVFFKRWAYRALGGTMTAPLVVARTGDWQPAQTPPPTWLPTVPQIVLAVAGIALVAAFGAAWSYRVSRRPTLIASPEGEIRSTSPRNSDSSKFQDS